MLQLTPCYNLPRSPLPIKNKILKKNLYKNLSNLAIKELFLCENRLFQQINDISIVSPQDSTIGNFFLVNMETFYNSNLTTLKSLF